ncbi:T9SS type A sorting domain-containing protein [Rosettibacter firmus]|uniref:T9SS type A sorting domain-containing protein n=1 Tax=Rosettibacter firmus TaxID=3111522 RepID=UPI00336BCC76
MKSRFHFFILILVLSFYNLLAQYPQKYDSLKLVVIPAEKYHAYRPGLESKTGDTFTMEDSIAGFIGKGYMRANMAKGDGSITNAETINIKLSYNVEFVDTGVYYIWAFVYFPNDKSDSYFFGTDGKVVGQVAGQPRGVWSWHKGDKTIHIDSTGVHSLDFFGREPNALLDHIIITASATFDPNVNKEWESWGLPSFTQKSDTLGLVIMPAEKYDFYRPGLGIKTGDTFTMEDSVAGFIGQGYMKARMAKGDGNITNAETVNIKLSYIVDFVKTGTHYLWANVFFPDGNSDSYFFGIDGKVVGQVSGQPRGVWSWHKGTATFEIDTPGVHSIDFFGREPNALLDHIIITPNPNFDPNVNKEWKPKVIAFVSLPGKVDPATGEHLDKPFIDDLIAEGYEVYTLYHTSLETAQQSFIDSLNSADLVIIGRSGFSGDFGGTHKVAWNNIRSPLLLLQLWAARNNRLNWLPTGTTTSYDTGGEIIKAKIELPDDPVFTGVNIGVDSTINWCTTPYDFMGTTDGGNGVVLAREVNSLNVLFVRWEPWKEFYNGSIDRPAGYRTLIGNGNDHANATLGSPVNYYNFTQESKRIYLNEVARMVQLGKVEEPVSVSDAKNNIPSKYVLLQNYPNPFNPTTTIEFGLPEKSNVKISVYDILGRLVTTLLDKNLNAGYHKVTFNASNLTSGVYFYKIEAGNFVKVKKLMLIK